MKTLIISAAVVVGILSGLYLFIDDIAFWGLVLWSGVLG